MTKREQNQVAKVDIVIEDKEQLNKAELEAEKAQKVLTRTRKRLQRARVVEREAAARVSELRREARRKGTARAKQRLARAKTALEIATANRRALRSEERGQLAVARDAKALFKATRQRAAARTRAVRTFLQRWERDYDRKIRRRRKNVQLRKAWNASAG